MPGPARTWTLQEADQALPEVKQMLSSAREALATLREAKAHMDDLKVAYEDVEDEANMGHAEWQIHSERFRAAQMRLHASNQAFAARGMELKDADAGLVDFYAQRGDELVFLCWQAGEPRIQAWHALNGGFAGRRPVGDLMDLHKA